MKAAARKLSNKSSEEPSHSQHQRKIDDKAVTAVLAWHSLSAIPTALPSSLLALDLSHNLIASSKCPALAVGNLLELNLGYNCLASLAGLASAPALEFLDVSHNQLTDLDGLAAVPNLRVLNARSNRIASLTAVSILAFNQRLAEVIMLDNPCALSHDYRASLFNALQSLLLLDGKVCRERVCGYANKFSISRADKHAAPVASLVEPRVLHQLLTQDSHSDDRQSREAAQDHIHRSSEAEVSISSSTAKRLAATKTASEVVLGGQRPSKSKTARVGGKKVSEAAPVATTWMSPAVNLMCQLRLQQLQPVDAAATLEISNLQLQDSCSRRPRAVDEQYKMMALQPTSPTKLTLERKSYTDGLLQLQRERADDHLLKMQARGGRARAGSRSLVDDSTVRSTTPPPSPTRASLKRREHSDFVVHARESALRDHEDRVPVRTEPRFFIEPAEEDSSRSVSRTASPPPSPTRATVARKALIDTKLVAARRAAAKHEDLSSAPRKVVDWRYVQTHQSNLSSGPSHRSSQDGDLNIFECRDSDDKGTNSKSVLLQQLVQSNSDTLSLLRSLIHSKNDTLDMLRSSRGQT